MKSFRFPLETLLTLRRRRLQGLEIALAGVEARRSGALSQAWALEERSFAARESIGSDGSLRGADLRRAAETSEALLLQARASQRAAKGLERELAEARQRVLRVRRDVETVKHLRERRLAEWRDASQREEEALAAELYLARLPQRDNQ